MPMWLHLIVAFLGGGLASGLIGALANSRRERAARRAEFLQRQLQDLYGPLRFRASSNARLFEQVRKLQDLYKQEYIDTTYSRNADTQERVHQSAQATIDVENEYVALAVRNSNAAAELLESSYALVDPEDTSVFGRFLVDVARRKVEIDTQGRQRLPIGILMKLDATSFMPSDFIKAVEARFDQKRKELNGLLGGGS